VTCLPVLRRRRVEDTPETLKGVRMSAATLQTEMTNALNELQPFRDVNGMFYVQLLIPDAED
jgi:hypothetical protein